MDLFFVGYLSRSTKLSEILLRYLTGDSDAANVGYGLNPVTC